MNTAALTLHPMARKMHQNIAASLLVFPPFPICLQLNVIFLLCDFFFLSISHLLPLLLYFPSSVVTISFVYIFQLSRHPFPFLHKLFYSLSLSHLFLIVFSFTFKIFYLFNSTNKFQLHLSIFVLRLFLPRLLHLILSTRVLL